MILKTVLGLSLLVNVALDAADPAAEMSASRQISAQQKDAAFIPLVQIATDCIMREVASDPRVSAAMRSDEINDLIVDSITACRRVVRTMIDAHDRMYGDGSGEAFLLGPYLDVLPAAVVQHVKLKAR
jgi:hypothetical protein